MNKEKRNKVIIALVIGALVIAAYFLFLKGSQSDPFIQVGLFDDNGDFLGYLSTSRAFSTINGVSGVSAISLTVTVTNTGEKPLTCSIVSVSPTPFDTALDKSAKFVPVTSPKKAAWTSGQISLAQFESLTQPVTFIATARCSYIQGTQTIYLDDKSGSISLTIEPDESNAGFIIGIDSGGVGTEYCGDGYCQVDETVSNCPGDCAVASNTKFRTSDLKYVSGSAVAYTQTCGDTLIAFGASSSGSSDSSSCVISGYTQVFTGLPGGFNTPSGCSGTPTTILLKSNTDQTLVRICSYGWSGVGCGSVYRTFDSDDSDKTNVDTTRTSFDTGKEISC